ncbi:GNAT family N-acetyltransferase [Halococcus sediminicola]|uniref:GNAT family N-acetyltransferase n=1 Tax=Halococcus sediminicola TaxID=1264579 RepID=UPI0006789505|nr:GNAT family N-acetyltransferase [Halococcus sediminicola]
MKLIEATAEDLDAIVDRWYSLAKSMEAYSELNELSYADVDEVSDDGFRAHLDDEEVTDYLIVHETESIGFLTLREGYHSSREYSHYLRIVNLAIDEDRRNRGHGSEVVDLVKEIARDRGCDHLKVSCEWHNKDARRFYHDTDFRPKQVDYAQSLN